VPQCSVFYHCHSSSIVASSLAPPSAAYHDSRQMLLAVSHACSVLHQKLLKCLKFIFSSDKHSCPVADPGICLRGLTLSSPISSHLFPLLPSLSSFFLRSRVPLNQLGGLGCVVNSPIGVRGGARPKTNLMHSKAVRKPLVAIILSACFTVKRSIFSS